MESSGYVKKIGKVRGIGFESGHIELKMGRELRIIYANDNETMRQKGGSKS